MKKLFLLIALFTVIGLGGIQAKTQSETTIVYSDCGDRAVAYGEFMAGFNGHSGAYYAIQYYEDWCKEIEPLDGGLKSD